MIGEAGLIGFDLNLMVVFLTVYQQRSVSRAAACLNVGQPAVSGSLARLRSRFDDPLFIRHGRGIAPSAKAEQIADRLAPLLQDIEELLSSNMARVPLR
ncbi:MAG: LysR family transcriptional regulator [Pseudomonas sp.]|uniref:LysR family transcriptional regulator n=1 Tax=Pseudomonas sp. TaxID=306 RepID=UPI0030F06EAD